MHNTYIYKAAIEKELQSTKLELRKAVEQTEKKTKVSLQITF